MFVVAAALTIASLLCPTASRAAEKTENAQTVAAVKVAEVEVPKTTTTCDAQCEQLRAAVEHLPKGGSSPSGDSAAEQIVLGGGTP
jgi:hypothetical protein